MRKIKPRSRLANALREVVTSMRRGEIFVAFAPPDSFFVTYRINRVSQTRAEEILRLAKTGRKAEPIVLTRAELRELIKLAKKGRRRAKK